MEILVPLLGVVIPMVVAPPPGGKRQLEAGDLLTVMRISNPALSPDGKWVACGASLLHTQENKNKSSKGFGPL